MLGVALQAMPWIRFDTLSMHRSALTAAGIASLAPALRRPWGGDIGPWGGDGLKCLYLQSNPSLGDDGVAALAKALPPTLEQLFLAKTGCGDDGLVALAAALPSLTRLRFLDCSRNPTVMGRGWIALASALPSMPALEEVFLNANKGVGSEGAVMALAEAVPKCPRLEYLELDGCGLDEKAEGVLTKLARPANHPSGQLQVFPFG